MSEKTKKVLFTVLVVLFLLGFFTCNKLVNDYAEKRISEENNDVKILLDAGSLE